MIRVPVGLARLRGLSADFAHEWAGALGDGPGPRYQIIASGLAQLGAQLEVLEARTRASMVNMQTRWWVDPFERHVPLDERSTARGVTITLIVPRRAIELSPLLPSLYPDLLVAPIFQEAMLIDSVVAVLNAGFSEDGERLFCTTTDVTLIAMLREIEAELRRVAVGSEEVTGKAPLTERQTQVALAVARGDKDVTTARNLDTSVRTVEREVQTVLTHLGVSSRQQAAMAILGERS